MLETSKAPETTRGNNPAVDDGIRDLRVEADAVSQNGIDGMELLLILSQRKMTILKVTLAVAVVAAIVMFLIPNTYTATATILPPEEKQSSVGAMLGQLGSIAGLSESDLGLKNPGDLFIGMLHSRTIQDQLINKFDLRRSIESSGIRMRARSWTTAATSSPRKKGSSPSAWRTVIRTGPRRWQTHMWNSCTR